LSSIVLLLLIILHKGIEILAIVMEEMVKNYLNVPSSSIKPASIIGFGLV